MLAAPLYVNDTLIGGVHIVRRRGDQAGPDHWFVYDWTLDINGERKTGEVIHRYGDGAWALVAKVIEKAGKS